MSKLFFIRDKSGLKRYKVFAEVGGRVQYLGRFYTLRGANRYKKKVIRQQEGVH